MSIYGRSKHAGEEAAYAAAQDGRLHITIVRPPVVYGPRDDNFLTVLAMAQRRLVLKLGFRDAWFSVVHPHDLTRGILLAGDAGKSIPVTPDHALSGGGLPPHVAHDGHHASGQGIYFITDGGRYTWVELGQIAARVLGKKPITVVFPVTLARGAASLSEAWGKVSHTLPIFNRDKVREGAATGWWSSIERARDELGFAPEMDYARGIEQTIGWAREHGKL